MHVCTSLAGKLCNTSTYYVCKLQVYVHIHYTATILSAYTLWEQ